MSTLWVCEDCYATHHGVAGDHGTAAPDREPLGLIGDDVEISSGLPWSEHIADCENVAECECETQTFSWSRCDGCGSTLGGARYALTQHEN